MITGGERARLAATSPVATHVQPTIFAGDNSMRIFQEEIFGPVVSVTSFADYDEAIRIANDTLYGLGRGMEPQRQSGLPGRPGHQSRPGVDQLLSRSTRRTPHSADTNSPVSAGEPQDDIWTTTSRPEPAEIVLQ